MIVCLPHASTTQVSNAIDFLLQEEGNVHGVPMLKTIDRKGNGGGWEDVDKERQGERRWGREREVREG